jgi:hypothetical protein
MNAVELMLRLADVIDGHQWDELPSLLDADFRCRYMHTGEEFDRDGWVRLNADYPGFQHFRLQDCLGSGDRAAGRAYVTGSNQGQPEHFGVATFITARSGRIVDMAEVWTDITDAAPTNRRPQ